MSNPLDIVVPETQLSLNLESRSESLPPENSVSGDEADYLRGLNAQQREAVNTPADEPLQVLAGAGTGKTELISRRFIKLVKDFRAMGQSLPQERILVVTFTSDAAAGMRERIHQRLLDHQEAGLGPDAWISTFHQFCMRLLRTHPLEIGLPPDFGILNTLEQRVLFSRVLQGVLVGGYPDISDVLAKTGLTDSLSADVLSIDALRASGIEDLEALLDVDRIYRLISRIKTSGLSPLEFLKDATRQTRQLTEHLKALPVPHDPDLEKIENIQWKISAWRDCLSSWAYQSWDPLGAVDEKAEKSGKKITPSDYKNALPGLVQLYLAERSYEPKSADFSMLDAILTLETSIIRIITAIYALYQDALLSQGACDFDDLINHSVHLLTRFPDLRARYQQKFSAIIVDEFQDSNGGQLRLLSLLMREGAKNLTVVGDEKQSIYAFRFAQPENLHLIFGNYAYKTVNLQINYRSRPPILDVANHLTRQITERAHQTLKASDQNAEHTEPKVIWVHFDETIEKENGKQGHKPVELQKDQEARYIAVEIAELVRQGQCRFSDIAILVKSHAKAETIQKTLAGFNIPAIRQKNLGFFQEAVIKDALALLRLMRNPGDDLSLIRILQGKLNHKHLRDLVRLKSLFKLERAPAENENADQPPQKMSLFELCLRLPQLAESDPALLRDFPPVLLAALGDLALQLLEITRQKSRLSPVQLFLKLSGTVGMIDPETPAWQQKQQRISLRLFEKLLYLFSQNKPLRPTLDEVIETLEHYVADPSQELPVSEALSGEDVVRIMTVFAAKGLEFPVVFAAYTEKSRIGSNDSALLFDPQYEGKRGFGLILGKVNGLINLKREIYDKCWIQARGQQEAQRVFYVALTRAMQRLYVIRGSQSYDWSASDGYPPDAVAILSETRHGDFVTERLKEADEAFLRQAMAEIQEKS